ncbi:Metallo-hydrolase/oxidoreductase [Mollisia scopiformis]|uniref:Metallo-hydrolase/oxidoreductase n=1 Tax=Mollisia scopiformis TaxID=149040 RepID=A0A194XPS2_MOLSC|nr:Metallo-hydrolase/oxidoreductase [Mollisia scopiformis]KUJ22161.1 Metallo-hydrolase/oxidoreductase [Mollisia scopiformis]
MHIPTLLTLLAIPLALSSPLDPRDPQTQPTLKWTTYLQPALPVYDPPNNYSFSPTTLTLISGSTEAILIDTPLSNVSALTVSSWLTSQLSPNNLTLKYIYITHGHGDHFFGAPVILSHFPSATLIATAGTIAHALEQLEPSQFDTFWGPLFPGQIAPQTQTWTALPENGLFDLDGFPMQAVEVGQTDTYNSTVLHVPSLNMVVAGDAVYGSCFQYLQETSTPALRAEWLKALVKIEGLEPEIVIPAHRQEWDGFGVENLARTREYLRGWEVEVLDTVAVGRGKEELKRRVGSVFPERVGDYIFEISAEAAFGNGTA